MCDLFPRDQFGDARRWWRGHRNKGQLHLAGAPGVFQRHISFLETGRSRPSPEMVMHLGLVLDVSLRDRNAMLIAPGFALVYPERSIDDREFWRGPSAHELLLAITIRLGAELLSSFTIVATLASTSDITLQELRLETLFPPDEPTGAALHIMCDAA